MNITTVSSNLDWKTNNKGTWKALIKDLEPNGTITFSEGYTATVSGRVVTVSNSTKPVGTVTYVTDETNTVNTGLLYGAGTAYDSVEAVQGKKTVRMGSVDLGSLSWSWGAQGGKGGFYSTELILPSDFMICDRYISVSQRNWSNSLNCTVFRYSTNSNVCIRDDSYATSAEFKTAMSGVYLYYELAESTSSDVTTQSLSLTTGDDTLSGGSFDTIYEGTDYSIPLIRNCKYIYRDGEGNESLLTGSTTNTSKTVVGGQDKLINLTHWFGRNREPSIADFYKLYPTWKTYDIPYDQGSVLNYKGTGVETIGFNAYDHSTGTAALLGGNKYQICGTFTSVSYVDIFGNTETITLDSANCFTPINDGVLTVTGGNNTDTCVHLVWSGYKNYGEPEYKWEPFIRNVKEFPVSTYFPDGMNEIFVPSNVSILSADAHDELTLDGYVQRIGIVDGGDLTYSNYNSGSSSPSSYPYGYAEFNISGRAAGRVNLLCTKYPIGGDFSVNGLLFGAEQNSKGYIIDNSLLGLTGDQIKAKMTGVKILYELATPVVVSFNQPLNLAYPVNDFGTEHSLPQNTTTLTTTDLKALIKYNTDYMRMNSQLADIFPTVKSLVKQEQDGYIMKVDDYAPNARVGAADNLIDKNAEGTPAEFTYRTSGGDVDLTDGTAIAKKIKGTTLNLNQLVHDTNQNTVTGNGQVEVEDAVVSDVASLVVSGRSLVKNQLVPPSLEETENSSNGVVEVTDAVAGDALALKMTAPRSVVVNQTFNTSSLDYVQSITTNTVCSISDETINVTVNSEDGSNGVLFRNANILNVGHKYMMSAYITASSDTVIRFMYYPISSTSTAQVAITANARTKVSLYSTLNQIPNGGVGLLYINIGQDRLAAGSTVVIEQAQCIDLTQYFNGDQTLIDSITSWDDLVAYDPRFASYVAYNTGTVEGVTPSVKVSGKNLWSFGNQSFTYFKTLNFDTLLPAGQYYISALVTSTDTDVSYCKAIFYYQNESYVSVLFNRNNRAGSSFTITRPVYKINLYSADSAVHSLNDSATYTDIQLELGSVATSYEPYHDGGTAQAPVPLYGVGTASDSYDAVTGKVGHRTNSYTFTGNETWSYSDEGADSFWYCSGITQNAKNNRDNNVTSNGISVNTYTTNIIRVYLKYNSNVTSETNMRSLFSSGTTLYYELATPTEELLTPATLSLQTGSNVALQTDGGRTAPFSLTYDGTEFTLPLDSTHKYAYSDNGTKSIITSSSEQAVTGGQDMLVDVTRMFNGDTTAINAVTSWADMAAVMPEYKGNVAYNEGEVVGRSGGVTTAVWNQLYDYGVPVAPITGAYNYGVITSHDASTRTDVQVVQTQNASIGFRTPTTLPANHTYLADFDISYTGTGTQNLTLGYTGVYTTVFNTAVTRGSTVHIAGICAIANERKPLYIYVNMNTSLLEVGAEITLKNLQIFDLTEIYGAGHEPSTVEDFEVDCAKWGKDLTQYQPYDAGTPMGGSATFTGLHGVGSVVETQDVVSGEITRKIGHLVVDETLSWSTYANSGRTGFSTAGGTFPTTYNRAGYVCDCPIIVSLPEGDVTTSGIQLWCGVNNSMLYVVWYDNYVTPPVEWTNPTTGNISVLAFQAWLATNPFNVYYVMQEGSTIETAEPQPLTFAAGLNNVHEENVNITSTPINMEYTGTDYTIATKSARKYIKTIDGTTELVTGVSSVDVRGGRDNLIDLTRMFGATLEPGTLADFYQLFPTWNGYKLPYNKGSLLNYKGTGLKSVGFNLVDFGGRTLGEPQNTTSLNTTVRGPFDETKYYIGFSFSNYYSPTYVTSYSVSDTAIGAKVSTPWYGVAFPVRVVPGRTYRMENVAFGLRMSFYTYNGTYISYSSDAYAEAPANAYWGLLVYAPTTGNTLVTWTDPCVHLQWSGTRNGDYEPYWSYTRPVPTLTYFPDGMNGKGDVYDELNEKNYVKRFGKVDLGTLTWSHTNSGTYGYWISSALTSIAKPASNAATIRLASDYYTNINYGALTGTADSVDSIAVSSEGKLFINNGSTTQSPTGYLIYELATPVTTTYDETPNLTAQISDYGTEESLPTNGYVPTTAPFRGVVLYAADYARTITKLPENYISKESMEALMTLLGSLHNGTFTMTFNQSTNEYTFNFTSN